MRQGQHKNQWTYNEKFVNELLSNQSAYYDWIITITFYAALHKINYCFHKFGLTDSQINTHIKRRKNINILKRSVARKYIQLYTKSRKVRYQQRTLNNISKVQLNQYVDIWLKEIKPYIP